MLGIKNFLPSKKNEKKEQTIVLLCVDLYLITMYTYTVHAFFFFQIISILYDAVKKIHKIHNTSLQCLTPDNIIC